MQTLLLIGLWALLLQWGMLFFVRLRYRAWTWRKQHLVAGLVLPVMVAAMALWMRFGAPACQGASCAANALALAVALRLVGMMLVAALLLLAIDRVRRRS